MCYIVYCRNKKRNPGDSLMRVWNIFPALLLAVTFFPPLAADDAGANAKVAAALELARDGDHRGAAQLYCDADLLADDPQLKANALKGAISEYEKAGLPQREFEAIEQLLTRYPAQADYVAMTDRQLAIANAYYHGKREPAFWQLRWIPWLTGPDKTVEFYETALKRAPFAQGAPAARLRLAFRMDEENKPEKAMEQLRILIRDYPDAPERKPAYLALGELLFNLSQRGDGDGRYAQEAIAVFREFKRLYPKADENEFVDKTLLKLKDIQAERLLGIAKFYNRTGKSGAAVRYLNTVLKEYPDSLSAEESEALLVELDQTYTPDGFLPEVQSREPIYSVQRIPEQNAPLLIAPENSNGKYLLPVYDLGLDNTAGSQPVTSEEKNHENP